MRQNLIDARQRENMTQKELGEHLGLSQQTISDLERGKIVGKIDTWTAIEKLFNGHIDELRKVADSQPQHFTTR